ncbi:MAG TPA: phage protein NinX family protein [Ramlibacter sp.]|uniref:phage protein NinX family protein n=1 Tax=Ramlibacter sp. TaxID=1917967 RepID=UPI002D6AB90D|nr:phage protein NinX family protein [Ramlibacter sp.]HYD75752.1 phage protein NinX family protein [Ramlibacter sp.]HYE39260.1 phage protein NinX family protein [Ramlibacter sp.]
MAKHKTSELEGALLDAAVAKAEGREQYVLTESGGGSFRDFEPSSLWEDGGPIIERERIELEWRDNDGWWNGERVGGSRWVATMDVGVPAQIGTTPLIAAMRAYVASKLGEEVELP